MLTDFITWNADPVIFRIGAFAVRWYSLMFLIGFVVGYEIVARMFKREGAPERWLGTLLVWVVLATIIGSRLGHVLFYEWSYYSQHPIKILYVWEGGLASHGGTIGIILAVILFSVITTRRSPLWTFDRLVVPIALTGALIRLGNLFNSEIFGHATTLPWGFKFVRSAEWHRLYEGVACHPTQLYEAACYLALFALLMWMYWRKNAGERPGLIFGVFLTGIFVPRFLIEYVKNPQVAFEEGMALNMGQLLSLPFIALGIYMIARALLRPRVKIEYPGKYWEELHPGGRQ